MIEIQDVEKITEPGAYRVSKEDYHRDPCPVPSLSCGLAKNFLDASPLHAWWAHPKLNPQWEPEPPKRNWELGTACHELLLGGGQQAHIIDADSYRTKAAKEERAGAIEDGFAPILTAEYDRAVAIVAAARANLPPVVLALLDEPKGEAEVMVTAKLEGDVWMRSELDWWSADRHIVIDYKTTGTSASPAAFAKQIARMGYDFQDAFYQNVIARAFPELAGRLSFLFIVQEWDPPFALSVLEIAEGDRALAGRKVDVAIECWEDCLSSGRWPGYPSGIQRVTLPEWHTREWLDREMAGEEEGSTDWIFARRRG
jgi:hypothetical protein